MAINIVVNGDHRHDQSSGVQSGGTPDKDDIALSTDLNQLPDPFEMFLESLNPPLTSGMDSQIAFAADVGAAHEDSDLDPT